MMHLLRWTIGLLLLTATACAASHLPKKPAPPEPRDIECIVRLTAEPKVVGALYATRNGTDYFVVQYDRNDDQTPDLVLLYQRIGRAEYSPFPTIYFLDVNFDGKVDVEFIDQVGDGKCAHFKQAAPQKGP